MTAGLAVETVTPKGIDSMPKTDYCGMEDEFLQLRRHLPVDKINDESTNAMTEMNQDPKLDSLLEGWRSPQVNPHFTSSVVMNLPSQGDKVLPFTSFFGQGVVMGAAAAVLMALLVALNHSSRVAMESDLVELENHSHDAISELYRLTHLEGLAGVEEMGPEEANMALLLFATER
jgi:hypothetical protein